MIDQMVLFVTRQSFLDFRCFECQLCILFISTVVVANLIIHNNVSKHIHHSSSTKSNDTSSTASATKHIHHFSSAKSNYTSSIATATKHIHYSSSTKSNDTSSIATATTSKQTVSHHCKIKYQSIGRYRSAFSSTCHWTKG